MASNQFAPPPLAPDLMRRQMDLQRNQMLAQNLMQTEAPQGQMVSGHYVAPHFTQQLAAALRPVVGQQVMNRLPEQMAGLQQAQQDYDRQRFNSVFGGGSQAGADPRREFMIAQLMGLDKYAAEKLRQSAPTNEQKNLGFMPESQRNTLIAAPFLNEAGKDGVQMGMTPEGQVQAFAVPGYRQIQAGNAGAVAGAQEQAKAALDLVQVPDGQGGFRTMPRDQAAQELGGAPAQGAAQPQGTLGTKPADRVIEARTELPKVVNQAQQMINSIDGILSHPGLSGAVGMQFGESMIPGTPARDFVARADQLKGQAFLQAFESLKGGGQITEVEGKAATDAIGRLSRAQSEKAYKESLTELRGILETAINRAYEKAGVAAPERQAPAAQPAAAPAYSRESLLQEAKRRGLIK